MMLFNRRALSAAAVACCFAPLTDVVALRPSAGCASTNPIQGALEWDATTAFDGGAYSHKYSLPSEYGATPVPLLLFFHGWGGNSGSCGSTCSTASDRGYATISLTGIGGKGHSNSWNGFGSNDSGLGLADAPVDAQSVPGCPLEDDRTCNTNAYRVRCYRDCGDTCDTNDGCMWTTCKNSVDQTLGVLRPFLDEYCVDLDRIYASGCSNGGMFLYRPGLHPQKTNDAHAKSNCTTPNSLSLGAAVSADAGQPTSAQDVEKGTWGGTVATASKTITSAAAKLLYGYGWGMTVEREHVHFDFDGRDVAQKGREAAGTPPAPLSPRKTNDNAQRPTTPTPTKADRRAARGEARAEEAQKARYADRRERRRIKSAAGARAREQREKKEKERRDAATQRKRDESAALLKFSHIARKEERELARGGSAPSTGCPGDDPSAAGAEGDCTAPESKSGGRRSLRRSSPTDANPRVGDIAATGPGKGGGAPAQAATGSGARGSRGEAPAPEAQGGAGGTGRNVRDDHVELDAPSDVRRAPTRSRSARRNKGQRKSPSEAKAESAPQRRAPAARALSARTPQLGPRPQRVAATLPGHASRIGGGNEATKNFAPPDVKTGPYHPSLKKLNDAQFEFLEKMLELGILSKDEATPLWNLFHWEWGNINPKAAYIVVLVLNYQTKEQALGLKDFHSSAALRSNGERIEKAWRHQAGAVGEENFVQTIHGDVFPLSYKHESSIEAEVGEENAKTVMYWWNKIVLSVLRNDDTFKIAFCSQSAVKSYAKHVYGKVDKDGEGDPSVMDEIHREHEGKYLSLAKYELAVGDHPCRIYRKGPSYRRGRRASCSKTDRFQTIVKRAISRNHDDVCTYYTDTFVDNGEEESTREILIEHHDDQSFVSAKTTHPAIKIYFSRNTAKICARNGLADPSEARVDMCFLFMCSNGGTEVQARDKRAREAVANSNANPDQRKRAKKSREDRTRGGANAIKAQGGGKAVSKQLQDAKRQKKFEKFYVGETKGRLHCVNCSTGQKGRNVPCGATQEKYSFPMSEEYWLQHRYKNGSKSLLRTWRCRDCKNDKGESLQHTSFEWRKKNRDYGDEPDI
ncbi:hypothetical protein ACHAXT_008497 [Thalassiosira profunda]